ncbi:MAG: tRNA (adenosine(37)-N6)-threonylcarbamoyltransferase complex dimerization subunit type 1 TsaB [Treponema sp.]|jgi:tRNA threonylcarbamoyladenosine biosynthesis protein TsaB|nr:tRNA (adenosine(37)-N6)-threonylcarbamoyltransferase complex dimerization subunit type 1 TsaB [Treponema sp.]
MNLLAVNTAVSTLSAAVAAGEDTWYFEADAGLRHSELLMDCIDLLMKKSGLQPEDLSGVLCMGGPGSFTGLRIGFSLAKGLALSLGIPFAPIPTLDCMARPFSFWPGLVIPVIDAKKNAFFCALYRNGGRLCPDMDAGAAEIARTIAEAAKHGPAGETTVLLTGPDAEKLHGALTVELAQHLSGITIIVEKEQGWGTARTLIAMARETPLLNNDNADYFSGPQYIRKSDAELQQADPAANPVQDSAD